MGRKPNPILNLYFTRGQALPNCSNRYAQKCTRCSADFPKGRPEALLRHLQQCSSIGQAEKDEIRATVIQINEAKALRSIANNGANAATHNPSLHPDADASPFTGLDALAEASRQAEYPLHLDEGLSLLQGHSVDLNLDGLPLSQAVVTGTDNQPATLTSTAQEEQWRVPHMQFEEIEDDPDMPADVIAQLRAFAQQASNPDSLRNEPHVRQPRSKPTEIRRQEISNMRKLRACRRCRMLRKPCSGKDPCDQCTGPGQAKTWTSPCTRKRLYEELEVYSAGIVDSEWQKRLQTVHYAGYDPARQASIWFIFDDDKKSFASIPGRAGFLHKTKMDGSRGADPILLPDPDLEFEDIPPALLAASRSDEEATSTFVQVSLTVAREMSVTDALLGQVVSLWDLTQILTGSEKSYQIYLSSVDHEEKKWPKDAVGPLNRTKDSNNHHLTELHILQVVEIEANRLVSSALKHIETRLLKRHLGREFSFFLTTVILVNCVERMTWFTLSFDVEKKNDQWWLPVPPAHFTANAEAFTDMIIELMSIRGVLPDLGILRSSTSLDEEWSGWLAQVDLSDEALQMYKSAAFDGNDRTSLDMLYISKMFR